MTRAPLAHPLQLAAALCAFALAAGCATVAPPTNVADTLAREPDLGRVSELLAASGLESSLKGQGPFTVFAPSDQALANMPQATLDRLMSDKQALKAWMSYHVVPGQWAADLASPRNVKTVQGSPLTMSRAGAFFTVEEAIVLKAGITATNGLVHIIDKALVPPAQDKK